MNGQQSAPFTLEINRPKTQPNAESLAARIEAASIEKLVKPYADVRALTAAEIQDTLNLRIAIKDSLNSSRPSAPVSEAPVPMQLPKGIEPKWLSNWAQAYGNMKKAS